MQRRWPFAPKRPLDPPVSADSPPLVVQDLCKRYKSGLWANQDISLTGNRGEILGILGPNGAGKTTAQRVLLDVIRPTRGSASVFGLDCQKQGIAIRKRVGYLPGELSLYPGMKAHAFLRMLASLRGNDVDDTFRQQLYERLNLDPSRKMKTYSRGNKQKVGIIAAFMGKPGLLVLDEVDKAEDRRFVRRLEAYFRRTHTGRYRTAWIVPTPLFVASDMNYAVQAADLCIYCVNWGFRLPSYGMDAPARAEIATEFGP